MSRKYSDNKYDKPEYEAKIEQQTLKAVEAMIKEPFSKKAQETDSKKS